MGVGPTTPIEAPQLAPPTISLLSSALVIEDTVRWQGGLSFEPETCGDVNTGTLDPCGETAKTLTTNPNPTVDYEPFGIWAGDQCSSFGFAARDWEGRAHRKLLACQSRLIEQELWLGTQAQAATPDWPNRWLADDANANTISSAPLSPVDALSCLEQALGDCNCGGPSMIHATRSLVTQWVSSWLVYREGNKLVTALGTIVVPGSGYDGSAPFGDPATDGSVWAYGTGLVHVRLSPVDLISDNLRENMDRTTNTIAYRAERLAAAYWDQCCHLAVEVDAPACPEIAAS